MIANMASSLKNDQSTSAFSRLATAGAILLTVLFTILLLGSCNKFLDTKPVDSITPETYYKTQTDLDRALSAVYDRLGDRRTYCLLYTSPSPRDS